MRISQQKKDKISEQILALLYSASPKALFTSHIAREIARDEEFIKKLLLELKEKAVVIKINKNTQGKDYLRRARWRLSNSAYEVYKSSVFK